MDSRSIAQAEQRRKRALKIAEDDHVRRDGRPNRFFVRSQTTDQEYIVDAKYHTCECFDSHRGNPHRCKHQLAAQIFVLAEQAAVDLAKKKNMTLSQIESRLLNDLSAGIPSRVTAQKLVILLHATQRLLQHDDETKLEEEIAWVIASKKSWVTGEVIKLATRPGYQIREYQEFLYLQSPTRRIRAVGILDPMEGWVPTCAQKQATAYA